MVEPVASLRAAEVEAATGWRVAAYAALPSTSDEAARRRDAGEDHVVVVADAQTAGRGRGGNRFASPPGGLYASLVLRVPPDDLPGPTVAATAVALGEAVEALVGVPVALKWPNDLWIDGRKVAGLLLEASAVAGRAVPVVVGVGVNVDRVPETLPPDVAATTTALALHARHPVSREALLTAFLRRLDARRLDLATAAGRDALEDAYRRRLALLGEPVRFLVGDVVHGGVLRDVSLARGLLVEATGGVSTWWAAAHVRELRPARP